MNENIIFWAIMIPQIITVSLTVFVSVGEILQWKKEKKEIEKLGKDQEW